MVQTFGNLQWISEAMFFLIIKRVDLDQIFSKRIMQENISLPPILLFSPKVDTIIRVQC